MTMPIILGCLLTTSAVLSWWLPRTFGLLGLLAAHMLTIVFSFLAIGVSLELNPGADYDPIGALLFVVCGAFLYNCLLLPVGVFAMFRWRRLSPLSPYYEAVNPETAVRDVHQSR